MTDTALTPRPSPRQPAGTAPGGFWSALVDRLSPPAILPHRHWDMGDLQHWRET